MAARTVRSARAASTCTSGRSSVPSTPGATPSARRSRWPRCGVARSRPSTPSTWAAGSRSLPTDQPSPTAERFARELPAALETVPDDRRPTRLAIEPGRALVARAGWLVARVLHVRDRGGRQVVLDAGMTELIRPALYGARHPIVALTSLGRESSSREPRRGAGVPSPRRSRARSASRRTRSARTTCRRSAGAISWPSPMRAPTPHHWARPTTGGHARRRSCGRRMAASRSAAGAAVLPPWVEVTAAGSACAGHNRLRRSAPCSGGPAADIPGGGTKATTENPPSPTLVERVEGRVSDEIRQRR